MREFFQTPSPEAGHVTPIEKLTDAGSSLSDRLRLARELFPQERKERMLQEAEKDAKGRPAAYFHIVSYDELRLILQKRELSALDQPALGTKFDIDILADSLRDQISQLDKPLRENIEQDFERLLANFTLETYMRFVLRRMPRKAAFELHAKSGYYGNVQGLLSLSIGGPMLPPNIPNPSPNAEYPGGIPVIEMIVPARELIISPLDTDTPSRESEKEVDVLTIKADWIIDVYQGEEDFNERFLNDPSSAPHAFSGLTKNRHGNDRFESYNAMETLDDWKDAESIVDLIPISRLSDLDPDNPKLMLPLVDHEE